MEVRKVFTIVVVGGGRLDQPCVVACPALGLRTDAATVASALEAMTRAVHTMEMAVPSLPNRPRGEAPSVELMGRGSEADVPTDTQTDAQADAPADELLLPENRRAGLAALYEGPPRSQARPRSRTRTAQESLRRRRTG